jgi:hypothetical protein
MRTGDVVYVVIAFVIFMSICSLPLVTTLPGAGPRYRATVFRQLAIVWAIAVGVFGWLVLGWFAIERGGRWFSTYRDCTLLLMGAYFALLPLPIWMVNRSLAAAKLADREAGCESQGTPNQALQPTAGA